ncbi:hypothetical protein DFH08DRAFT_1019414 [Mycena albidolilacea]|uniref:Uncharacterized protein n=1 Tax=Mycena albidolilacea TaxID=1033008 RepID=A0AAD7EKP3_9AGAR|nr:hypothetical protein DFH08DRAFT_1019414 [Mycena albidolilacea]
MHAATLLFLLLSPVTIATLNVRRALAPGGYRDKVNIYEVPGGGSLARIGNEIHVLGANGTVVHKATAGSPLKARPPSKVPALLSSDDDDSVIHIFTYWINVICSPYALFTGSWRVPFVPESDDGQTLFWVQDLEEYPGDTALMTVLQYGVSEAGGGPFYSASTWYRDPMNIFHTTPIRTETGVLMESIITLTSASPFGAETFDYNAQFTNIPGTSMNVTGVAQLNWASIAFEVFNEKDNSDYPVGITFFEDVNLKLQNGVRPDVFWPGYVYEPEQIMLDAVTQGSTNAQLRLIY